MKDPASHYIRRKICTVACLALLGFVANLIALPVALSVSFIFGSIFSIIALRVAGLWYGLFVALFASSYTYLLWNHPYAIIIFAAEIIWIGLALKRGRTNILLIDCLYWVVAGGPLVVLFYAGVMGMGFESTAIVVLKQSLNGILNALFAGIALSNTKFSRWLSQADNPPASYTMWIFNLVAVFLMIPTLGMMVFANHHETIATERRISKEMAYEVKETEEVVARWIARRINAVRVIADFGSHQHLEPSQHLQEELQLVNALFPDFHNVWIGDDKATSIAFYPPIGERGAPTVGLNYADRSWFQEMKRTLQPVVSEVFMGRGGVHVPIFTVGVPVVSNDTLRHFGLGAVKLDSLGTLFKRAGERKDLTYTIVDHVGNVVFSTKPGRKPLDRYEEKVETISPVSQGVYLRKAPKLVNQSVMQAWKNSSYVTRRPISGTPWILVAEYPFAPVQQQYYKTAIRNMGAVGIIFAVMLLIAAYVSKCLTTPLRILASLSKDIPGRIDRKENLEWPKANTLELAELTENLSTTADALYNHIVVIENANRLLEEKVEDRTEELQSQQKRLENIIHATNIGTWEWNIQTGEIYFNERWAEIIGYTLDELAPVSLQTWLDTAHPDDLVVSSNILQRHFRGELDYYEYECRTRHKQGHWVWILDRGKVVSWMDDGQPLLMSGTHQDISGRKQQEEELHNAKMQAESANRAKSEFLANMSHEIRTPMNGVMGMTQLLEFTSLTEEQKEYVDALKVSGKNLLSLINNILDLSKVEAGKTVLENSEFSLHHCINDVVLTQKAQIFGKRLSLDVDLADDIPHVLVGDQLRIKQILLNLLGNAIKFTEQGGITITAQALERSKTRILVQISICDTGVGISPEALGEIFKPFVQEDSSTTRKFGGTGLGLSICRRLVDLMAGSLTVDSTPGTGSCFKITLPLSVVDVFAAHPPSERSAQLLWSLPSLRILLVEDNLANCAFSESLLQKIGHEVDVAANGRECLLALDNGVFDVVLMDIQMPSLNGEEALQEIRKRENNGTRHQPVIALTAYSLQRDREHFLEAGFDGYVPKPLELSELVREMKRVMEMCRELNGEPSGGVHG